MKKPWNKSNQFRQVVELKSTFTKPLGSMEKARRNVKWTTARGMNTSPIRHWVMKGYTSAQIDRNSKKPPERNAAKKEPRLAKRRKGEEAKGRPSHIGRAILSQWACLTYDLSQLIIRNMRLTHTRSSGSEHLVVSRWCKFEHMFSNPVSAIVDVEDLCSNIERRHNEITFNTTFREEFL